MNLFAVLKHFDPMFGRDLHTMWPPGTPAPAAPVPHLCSSSMMGIGSRTTLWDQTVFTHFGWSMQRGTDIGPLIPHFPPGPNMLIPLIWVASASKSEWGSQQYLVKNKPAACALLMVINPNLNCCDPTPLPLDIVLGITTHFVGMTLGEIIAGALAMLMDMAIAAALNFLGSALFDTSATLGIGNKVLFELKEALDLGHFVYERALFKPVWYLLGKVPLWEATNWMLKKGTEGFMKGLVLQLPKILAMDEAGSPLGFSFTPNGFAYLDNQGKADPNSNDSPGFMERAYDAQRDAIDNPSVPTHDVPPAGAEGAPGMADAGSDGAGGASGADAPDAGPGISAAPGPSAASDAGPNMSVDPGASAADQGPNMDVNPGPSGAPDAGPNRSVDPGSSGAAGQGPNMSVDPGPSATDPGPNMDVNPGPSAAPDAGPNTSVDPGSSGAAGQGPNMSVDPGSSGVDEDPDGGR